jgi:predicted secreted protein
MRIMTNRRELLVLTGVTITAGLCNRWSSFQVLPVDERASTLVPPGGCGPHVAVTAPSLADGRHPIPISIRVEPVGPDQRVELVELLVDGRQFPGLVQFMPASRQPTVTLDCQIRLECSERLVAVARLSDGTRCEASCDVSVSSVGDRTLVAAAGEPLV